MIEERLREHWYQCRDGEWLRLWLTDQEMWTIDIESYGTLTALDHWFRVHSGADLLAVQPGGMG